METFNRKAHWENIYQTKALENVSWYQAVPEISLSFIEKYCDKNAVIIDIGGGDSFLSDFLLKNNYQNVHVLDISAAAIERAKNRQAALSKNIHWHVCDVLDFMPETKFDFWHDRAAFHFLTHATEINKYVEIAFQTLNENGFLSVGTFAKNGPTKCSGIEITQYDEADMRAVFEPHFQFVESIKHAHQTPFNSIQNFTFCIFKKA